jgi:hypothetical protein
MVSLSGGEMWGGRMGDDDPREQISRLEADIEELAEALERCRKIALASKLAIAAGGIWMVAFTFGIVGFNPMAMIGAITAVIGGTVIFGSTTSTARQTADEMNAAEARRRELIGTIEFRVVEGGMSGRGLLH